MTSADDTAGCPTQRPASADYITTTGERWSLDGETLSGSGEVIPGVTINGFIVTNARAFAELRALRAQRDELLAALTALWETYGWQSDITDAELAEATDGGEMVAARRAIARATGAQEASRG